jgi:transcriptional repressor NrdR
LCGLRFTTLEHVQTTSLMVVKQDGRHEEFDRAKVRGGLLHACAKRPVSVDAIEKLADDVERELGRLGRAEVPSAIIGLMIMERLRELDRVAYVRFASVYRNFQDVESFAEEVQSLRDGAEEPRPQDWQGQLGLPMNGGAAQPRPRRRRGAKPGGGPETPSS